METLSTFKAPPLHLPSFKPPPPPPPSSSHQPSLLLSRRNSISNNNKHHHQNPTRHQSPAKTGPPPPAQVSLTSKPQPPKSSSPLSLTTTTRVKPASGYAAALLDIALCKNSAEVVFKDAARFVKLMRSRSVLEMMRNPFVDETDKREVVQELAEIGRFEKHLVALVKMLIGKNKIGSIGEVLMSLGECIQS